MPSPITWNATRLSDAAGVRTDDFRGKWVNWLDQSAGGIWKQIDPSFEQIGNVFRADQGPWVIECPETATGSITVVNRQQFDVVTKDALNLPEMELTVTHPGARNVSGTIIPGREWQVCYPDAIDDGIDIVGGIWHGRGPRAEHVYVIRSMPPGDSDYVPITCEISAPGRWLPIPNGVHVPISNGAAARMESDQRRGIYIRPTVAWYYDADGELHIVPITADVRRITLGRTELTKYVPRTLIATALAARPSGELRVDTTSTFYPDPNVEVSTHDGAVYWSGTQDTWANVVAASGNGALDLLSSWEHLKIVCGSTTDRWTQLRRSQYLFDTSTIGTGNTVSAATFSIYGASNANTVGSGSPSSNIYSANPSSNTGASNSDYQAMGSTAYCDTPVALTSWSGGYVNYAMNATGIAAVTGITKIGLRESAYDVAASTPPWASGAEMSCAGYYAERTGTTEDPKLVVTYSAGGGGTAYLMMMMGSG